MSSPFPPSNSAPGQGKLVVHLLPYGVSALSTMAFQYPLKLISPSPSAHQKSVLVFLLTYGGGLVGGDQVHLSIEVNPKAKLSIVTQGHTKIFKSPTRHVVTRQKLDVTIKDGAGLCLLPDPVQPFEGSVYEQFQRFTLEGNASLCLLDWVSAGRTARGEDWDLRAWTGRNEIWVHEKISESPKLLLRDNVVLEGDRADSQARILREKMQGMGIFGTLVLTGKEVGALGAFFLRESAALPRIGGRDFRSPKRKEEDDRLSLSPLEAWRQTRQKQERDDEVLWSAATIRGCVVVKFGARLVEGARTWLCSMLREDGTISDNFGEDAMMCVR